MTTVDQMPFWSTVPGFLAGLSGVVLSFLAYIEARAAKRAAEATRVEVEAAARRVVALATVGDLVARLRQCADELAALAVSFDRGRALAALRGAHDLLGMADLTLYKSAPPDAAAVGTLVEALKARTRDEGDILAEGYAELITAISVLEIAAEQNKLGGRHGRA